MASPEAPPTAQAPQPAPAPPPVLVVRSFAAAIWLMAKGYDPLSAAPSLLGDNVDFLFHRDAKETWAAYYPAKDKLNLMMRQARAQA